MTVKRLVRLGIPANDSATSVRFFREPLGTELASREGNAVTLAVGNGGSIQSFGTGHLYFEFLRG